MNSDAVIIFPPQWAPVSPYSALPLLGAALRRNGISTRLLDLNCLAYDALLSRAYLNSLRFPDAFAESDPRYPFRWMKAFGRELADRIEDAKAALRDPSSFFDAAQYLRAENTLRYALFLISLSFWPQRLELDSLDLGVPSSGLFSPELMQRPFGSFLFEDVMEQILPQERLERLDRFGVVGFSVHTKYQLFYALRMIRHYLTRGAARPHVTLGGTFISSLEPYHHHFQPIFAAGVDTIVYARGDETLVRLCRLIAEGKNPASCPGILHADGETIIKNGRPARSAGPLPVDLDYSDLPLEKYLAPAPILNIPAGSGCYWGKCRFCNYHDVYRALDADRLALLMRHLGKRHKTPYFFLAQSALNYPQAAALSEQAGHAPDHLWGSLARMDRPATAPMAERLYAAGCRKLSLGLETRSESLRHKMNKGPLSPDVEGFLACCRAVGIGVEIFLVAGYPGETLRDIRRTLSFVRRFLPLIDTLSANDFSLVCNAASYADMRKDESVLLEKDILTFADIIDQRLAWRYRDARRAALYERRRKIFWEGLIDIVEASPSHIWRGNTASRAGFPRLPEHHYLYCASRRRLERLDSTASVRDRLTPVALGDQVISIDFETMTIADM